MKPLALRNKLHMAHKHVRSSRNIGPRVESPRALKLKASDVEAKRNCQGLVVDTHNIQPIKCPRTVGALSHAVADPVIHALVAEQVTASLQGRVLEVVAADST